MSERLQTTIKHFQAGVTSMGLTAARHSIESWQTELQSYDGKAFETIVTDLGHLHDELGKDTIDGKKVGKLLTKLGPRFDQHRRPAARQSSRSPGGGKTAQGRCQGHHPHQGAHPDRKAD